jgi:glyoxylase-like metal-dependent hydrolase (beta-lactamase superfamily II)
MTQQSEATSHRRRAKAGALIIPVTLFEQNCTLLWCEATKKAVVIDPGGDVDKIQAAIKQANVTVEKIWLTHGHIDHVGGAADLRDALQGRDQGPHIDDKFLTRQCGDERLRFGMPACAISAGPLARRRRSGLDRRSDLRHPALPRPFAGQRGVLQQGNALSPMSATCCSAARSAAPTFPAAITAP